MDINSLLLLIQVLYEYSTADGDGPFCKGEQILFNSIKTEKTTDVKCN